MEKRIPQPKRVNKSFTRELLKTIEKIEPTASDSSQKPTNPTQKIAPRPNGRPTVMTEEVVNKLEEVFAIDGTVGEACFYANISKQTYYDWLEKNPGFSDRVAELRERPVLLARKTVVKNLSNPAGAQWYLTNKARKEFGMRGDEAVADVGKTNVYNFFISTEVQNEVRSMEDKIKQALVQPRNVQ
jgi:hypothetical protein